jgi:tetratricopeptide (TPR) repeat protein
MLTMLRQLGICLALAMLLSGARILRADTAQANSLLQQGKVDQASTVLKETLVEQPNDAFAHHLLCRVYYAQGMADAAIRECETAAAHDADDSATQMWLGRAYGLKASRANALSAFVVAKKVHIAFERAVEIDPDNVHAMSDLGEYYVAAPSIVGGGLDRSRALAARMRSRFPSQAHRLLALIAEKENNTATAEIEFKAAVTAGRTPEAYVDLAAFYERHQQSDKALEALQAALRIDRRKDAALVDVASILTSTHRSPELAESVLREYLSSPARSDAAPAFKVHVQLGKLLASTGDTEGAHREYTAALALASHYAPARKALQGS